MGAFFKSALMVHSMATSQQLLRLKQTGVKTLGTWRTQTLEVGLTKHHPCWLHGVSYVLCHGAHEQKGAWST